MNKRTLTPLQRFRAKARREGYVTNRRALLTVLGLRAVVVGDEVVFYRKGNTAMWRGHVHERTGAANSIGVVALYDYYTQLEHEAWTLVGWRKPR